jgi:hypothetical protein
MPFGAEVSDGEHLVCTVTYTLSSERMPHFRHSGESRNPF